MYSGILLQFCIFLMTTDVEHLFMCFFPNQIASFLKYVQDTCFLLSHLTLVLLSYFRLFFHISPLGISILYSVLTLQLSLFVWFYLMVALGITIWATRKVQEKEVQEDKVAVWGGFTNSWEKKRRERQRRKGKIDPFECRVPKNSKEIRRPSIVINANK